VVLGLGSWALVGRWPSGSNRQPSLKIIKEASQSGFDYLVPGSNPAWQFDPKSPVFDATKGVVNYPVVLRDGNVKITISQQKMPEELKPYDQSPKFNQFIISSNVTFSEPVGKGKAYFRTALQNGAPAGGATTVIYATTDVLVFGQAGAILDYATWAKLLESLHKLN
jgi:hypothetical protein